MDCFGDSVSLYGLMSEWYILNFNVLIIKQEEHLVFYGCFKSESVAYIMNIDYDLL